MSTEDRSGMDDVERSLEAVSEEERLSIRERLSNIKDSYVNFHKVTDEDKETDFEEADFLNKPAAGDLSRRGFLSLVGQTAVVGYAAAEALDGDGYAIDWAAGEAAVTDPTAGETADTPEGIGVVGDVSDELYLQEDGTVYALDHGDREWRSFEVDEFPMNADYAELHTDLSGSRETMEPAPGVSGIEVTQQELFGHSSSAYDDMADEAEWDLIFDSNPTYSGGN
ncbi:hypothetical protein [Candidatus Nanohalococcus occultus]|uniref:hypothetical protein n=1 Tax=Candidatus Nanohalococcus occultus TaxID=2978047 RepID=UPI0039E05774